MSGVEWTAVTLMTVRNGNLWMRGNVEQGRLNYYAVWTRTDVKEMDMALLLREAIGDTLRSARSGQGKTLREVSDSARVSLGYLSEVERGRKEASSELLAAICGALDVPLSRVLSEVSERLRGARFLLPPRRRRWRRRPGHSAGSTWPPRSSFRRFAQWRPPNYCGGRIVSRPVGGVGIGMQQISWDPRSRR